jgi:hypothetical protein
MLFNVAIGGGRRGSVENARLRLPFGEKPRTMPPSPFLADRIPRRARRDPAFLHETAAF